MRGSGRYGEGILYHEITPKYTGPAGNIQVFSSKLPSLESFDGSG
jgi:hypothetical protein